MRWRPFRTALVLGGGGARGLAHLGVLNALRVAGVPAPDFVVGTSFGAVVGAAYALEPDATELDARFRTLLDGERVARVERRFTALVSPAPLPGLRGRVSGLIGSVRRMILWNRHALAQSLVDSVLLVDVIDHIVGAHTFADLHLPFYAVTYDLANRTDVIVGEGSLALALRASSAIPGIFEPVAVGDRILVDGAVFQELPTRPARDLGADFVIAVDVGSSVPRGMPASAADVMQRVLQIRGERLRNESRSLADVVITPETGEFHWSAFSRAAECLEAGFAATHQVTDTILHRMRAARRRTLFRRLFPRETTLTVSCLVDAAVPLPAGPGPAHVGPAAPGPGPGHPAGGRPAPGRPAPGRPAPGR